MCFKNHESQIHVHLSKEKVKAEIINGQTKQSIDRSTNSVSESEQRHQSPERRIKPIDKSGDDNSHSMFI